MAHVKADRVQETTTSTGTGALTLAGATSKFRAFSAALADTDTCVCLIEHTSATEWEISLCTFASGAGTLTRSTIYASSTGSAVSFTAGTKTISLIPTSSKLVVADNSDTVAVTSASATSLAIGPAGATNPVIQVDSSTASQAAGLKLTGATSAGTVAVAVISSGSNANLSFDAKGSGTITLGGTSTGAITLTRATTLSAALTYGGVTLSNAVTGTGNMALSASPTFTGTVVGTTQNNTTTSATGFTVGTNGTTTPIFAVDCNTGSAVAGFKITGAATGGTVALVATDSGADTSLTFNAKGTGTIGIGSVSTGRVTITPVTTITGALTLTAVGLVYNGVTLTGTTGTGSMVLSASPTFTGTTTVPTATISGAVSSTSWTTAGKQLLAVASTLTDTSGSGTIGFRVGSSFAAPTFASSSSVTITDAANVYIAGPPAAGTNTTITTPWSLYVGPGNVAIEGYLAINGAVSSTSWTTSGRQLRVVANTLTDTTGSGTITQRAVNGFGISTLASSSAVTVTDAGTVWIGGPPTAGTNTTLTNAWSLYVETGNVSFPSTVFFQGGSFGIDSNGNINLGGVNKTPFMDFNSFNGTLNDYDVRMIVSGGTNGVSGGGTLAITAAIATYTSANATSLAVGPAGSTNPVFQVDSSTASQAAGLKLTGATSAGTVALAVISSGADANITFNAKGTGTIGIGSVSTGRVTITPVTTITGALTLTAVGLVYNGVTLTGTTGTGNMVLSAAPALTGIATGVTLNLTSTSATSFVVGRQGTTTPAFSVDSSTGSQTGGLKVTGSALNGTVAVVVTDTSGNTNLTFNALGSGTIGIGSVSTGRVTITPVTTITGALTLASSALSTSASAGVGYGTGAGGAVTQATSKTTGVTLNTMCGQITMNNAALASGATVIFTVTNSSVAAVDAVICTIASGGTTNAYSVDCIRTVAGSFNLAVDNNTGGSLSEAPVINFAIIKSVTS